MARFPERLPMPGGSTLLLDPGRVLLALRAADAPDGGTVPSARWPDLFARLAALGLEIEGDATGGIPDAPPRVNHTAFHLWVRARQETSVTDEVMKRLSVVLRPHLDWIGPVYRTPGTTGVIGAGCPFPHVVVLRPSANAGTGEFDELPGASGALGLVEVPERSSQLGGLRYFTIREPRRTTAYALRERILQRMTRLVDEVLFESMPMASPAALEPNDTLFGSQWNLTRIEAPAAWDIAVGSPSVVVAVIDSGCDLDHADLSFSGPGLNLATMRPDGSPTTFPSGALKPHGTQVAGVIAAGLNNARGVAGLAGGCRILPIATVTHSDMEIAAGIRYAATQGAKVINMSFATDWFSFWDGPIPAAIEEADRAGCVMCASAGNGDSLGILRPAEHPLVMACGGSNRADARWRWVGPDGTTIRGSNYGDTVVRGESTGVSLVAPAEDIPTTDITGREGSVVADSPAGDYDRFFWQTSSAAPHVSGLAALLFSADSSLTAQRVRSIIERTAEKVGPIAYADVPGFPNGTRNPEMGYGRINAFRALELADVMIRDWPGDDGIEPSSPPGGNFYAFSDIVVRPENDGDFRPDDAMASSQVVRGRENHVYVRVRNLGPRTARDVVVDLRATAYAGTEFVYPDDWMRLDETHVQPAAVVATFASIPRGGAEIARFTLSVDQVERLYGWTDRRWHPCLLAQVTATNDYAFGGAALTGSHLIVRRNNIAQRNLSIVETTSSELRSFAFVAGNRASEEELLELVIRAAWLGRGGSLLLCLDSGRETGVPASSPRMGTGGCCGGGMKLLDTARVETSLGGCCGVLTLEKGSTFDPCAQLPCIVAVDGGKVVGDNGRSCVEFIQPVGRVRIRKSPSATVPLLLTARIPSGAGANERFLVDVAQRNAAGRVAGGAVVVFVGAG